MICTTVISNVDSTLANFTEDAEKKEIEAFKAYLRSVVANYAAADSTPAPPKIPAHSRPSKSNGSGSGKEKSFLNKVVIAIPQLPKPSQVSQKTWVVVARKGQKKARLSPGIKTQVTPVSIVRHRGVNRRNHHQLLLTKDFLFVSPKSTNGEIYLRLVYVR